MMSKTLTCDSQLLLPSLWILLLISLAPCFAMNRVLVEDFKWAVAISSKSDDNVDIYYYPTAEPLLNDITEILSDSYKRTSYLKKDLESRAPFFIYISQNDFEQSLIANVSEGTGGVTEAFKNRFIVGHRGSLRYLNYVIAHEYTHVIENDILFSGWWRSARLVKFPFYPLWLMEGLSEYSSGDLDIPEREMLIRDAVLNDRLPLIKHLHNFSHLEPNNIVLAYKTSEMLMRFIAKEYGEDKLALLLDVYKHSYDASSVIESVLGLRSLEDLDFRFREWCYELYSEDKIRAKNNPEGTYILPQKRKTGFGKNFSERIHSPVMLPDGKLAYLSDKRGSNEIWIYDPIKRKEKLLVGAKNNFIIDYISEDGRGLNMSPDGKYLVFVGEKNKKEMIFVCEINSSKITSYRPQIDGCKSISSPYFFPDGKKIIFTAMKGCFRDLFVYDITDGSVQQLTEDAFDDTDPVVTPDGKYVVYSSERRKGKNFWDYDLFVMEIPTRKAAPLTEWEWDERTPIISNSGKTLAFRAEPDLYRNIYIINNFDETVSQIFQKEKQELPTQNGTAYTSFIMPQSMDAPTGRACIKITDTAGGCFDPRFTDDENIIIYSLYHKGTMEIMRLAIADKTKNLPTNIKSTDDYNIELHQVYGSHKLSTPSVSATTQLVKHPYVFKASTDLFFPFIYYSSLDGLFLATYWQFSDILSMHNTQIGLLYSEYDKRLNYLWQYIYSRYRPQIFLASSGDNIYYNYKTKDYARYDDFLGGVSYPFDRFRNLEISARTIFYKDFTTENNLTETRHWREDYINCSYNKNTSVRKYLETTSGDYLRTRAIFGFRDFGGATKRTSADVEYRHWLELTPALILYNRFYGSAFLYGTHRIGYHLGGDGRVRGYKYKEDYISEKIFTATVAGRFPLAGNINYYMWYLFPDFYLKTLTGEIFIDAGIGEYSPYYRHNKPPLLYSGGASLKLYTFILQSYPLIFKIDWAKPFSGEQEMWYFKISSYLAD